MYARAGGVHAAGSMAGQWPSTVACNENRLVFDARVDITKQITAATNPITEQKAALCPELESEMGVRDEAHATVQLHIDLTCVSRA